MNHFRGGHPARRSRSRGCGAGRLHTGRPDERTRILEFGPGSLVGRPDPGQRVVEQTLTARPVTLDLGGSQVATWAYGDSAPGAVIRATAGEFVRVTVDNQLPADTSIHWHGIRLPSAADGVPGMTQDPIRTGEKFVYGFTATDPGTYFFHPHVGVNWTGGCTRRS